jgi:protocatechuate 3,4-dioxygenase beta subunit
MKKVITASIPVILLVFSAYSQIVSTSLRITVRDDLGNLVENAVVTLYATEGDYKKRENPVTDPMNTNAKGEVRFSNLQPQPYYVDVQKDDLTNEEGGVVVSSLQSRKINRITIIIQ